MTIERFDTGDIIPFRTRFEDDNGNGIPNAVGVVYIQRFSNNEYWNGSSFQVARTSVAMDEIDEINSLGKWEFDFDTSVGDDTDVYLAEFEDTSGNSVNTLELLTAFVGGYINELTSNLARVLGVSKDNMVLDPTLFSVDKVMVEGDIRVYDTPANAVIDNGVTGLLYEWHIVSPRNDGKLSKYTQTRVV